MKYKLCCYLTYLTLYLHHFSTEARSVTYNLLDYSQVQVTKSVTRRINGYCVKDGEDYKCRGNVPSNKHKDESLVQQEGRLQRKIRKSRHWQVIFDNATKGIDITVAFRKHYVVNNVLLAFEEANNLAAGYIKIMKQDGNVHKINFAASRLICDILFDPEVETCHVRNITSALKYVYEKPVGGTSLTIHLFPPISDNLPDEKSGVVTISHFKIYGECFCSNGQNTRCIEASEDNTLQNNGQRTILLCSTDVNNLPFSYFVHKRKRRSTCECSSVGTLYKVCYPIVGLGHQCPCKHSYRGKLCNKCSDGYHGYPDCNECFCHYIGSKSADCDVITGKCKCHPKYSGLKCNKCARGRYNFPFCFPCPCPTERTKPAVCDSITGKCHCSERFQGEKCASCAKWFQNFPVCHRPGCKCNKLGAYNGTCNNRRNCFCKPMYTGKRCDMCKAGYGNFPKCKACDCNAAGSYSNICDARTGQCHCKPSFKGKNCDQCKQNGLVSPDCEGDVKCKCHKEGSLLDRQRKGPCINELSCLCKENVQGTDCSRCKFQHYGLSGSNHKGCSLCNCYQPGCFGNIATCNNSTGQCYCKEFATGKRCDKCRTGYYSLNRYNLFGCTACNCDVGGSLSPNCDDLGSCKCKPNFQGKTCSELKKGQSFVPDYYHNLFEMENAMSEGKPVISQYNSIEFPNFTGKGYISFTNSQTNTKLAIEVPKTRKYILLLHYMLRREEKASILVYFNSKDGGSSYVASIDLAKTDESFPRYATFTVSEGRREIVLTKGSWDLELSSRSQDLLVDHVVLVPEEYYTAKRLQPKAVQPCLAGQPKETLCIDYKYIDLKHFLNVQAESGTNSKGYGPEVVKNTRLFNDPDILQQLPVINDMAELSPKQIALTLEVNVVKKGSYHIVVTYFNPDDRTYRLDLHDSESGTHGSVEALPCLYRFLCRAVVLIHQGRPFTVTYDVNRTVDITFLGNIRGSLSIDYVTFIPVNSWSPDHIIPRDTCIRKDGSCLQNIQFQTPDDAIRMKPTKDNPLNPLTKAVYVTDKRPVYFTASIVKSTKYIVVYQYYQPNSPRFQVSIDISNKNNRHVTTHVNVPFCPSNVGCRATFTHGTMDVGEVTLAFEVTDDKELWIDSVYFIPEESYQHHDYITPKRTELTSKFKRSCLDYQGLPKRPPPDGFCSDALVTLTSEFTSQTFTCNCNKRGAVSQECNRIGGHCKCKANVIGKNCNKCKTGYYGFPNCKACNCFIAGAKSADCNRYGQCTCKAQYTGRTCNRCRNGNWGFPDCRPCSCDRRGSFTLTCRSTDGQCPCLRNYASRSCSQCQIGFFDFPYCRSCNCHSAGILVSKKTPTGCYRNNPDRCDCKQNVEGSRCNRCKVNYYNMQLKNPLGCTACNCSAFGSIRGAGTCHRDNGQCICQPNVIGRRCDTCKDGFYVVKKDKVFSCQPCLCSSGGSLHSVCDKMSGQCKCKPKVGGLKCDREGEGGYYLPSIGQYIFSADDIVPHAPHEFFGDFDGALVNGSFASRRVSFNVTEREQTFYVMVYYSLTSRISPRIDIEFSKDDQILPVTNYLKAKEFQQPTLDIMKQNNSYLMMNLTQGVWHLQLILHHSFILNQITMVPIEQISKQKVSKSINNPCTITDGRRYCSMYTYFELTNVGAILIQGEELSNDGADLFDLEKYRGANIDGAVKLSTDKGLTYSLLKPRRESFYVVIQYMNTDVNSSTVELTILNKGITQKGTVELFPCIYAFGCRQVILVEGTDSKLLFNGNDEANTITLKAINKYQAYIDFIALIPKSKWNPNVISPAFYCNRRLSRCIDGEFPSTSNSQQIEAKKSLGVKASAPPDGHPTTLAVLMTPRRQRNLRWIKPIRTGSYYMVIHYYQPLFDQFPSKVVVMTYQRAVAGKVFFNYCPSVHGCRSVVKYLLDDENQRFSVSGNILRVSFTLPRYSKLWVERIVLVPVNEFNENVLELNPLDITHRYLRKCIGRQSNQIEKANREFCRSATFELTLGLNKYPTPCQCNARGSHPYVNCNPQNGQCSCKQGFRGKDCSKCVQGFFPHCRAKSRMFRYSYFL